MAKRRRAGRKARTAEVARREARTAEVTRREALQLLAERIRAGKVELEGTAAAARAALPEADRQDLARA